MSANQTIETIIFADIARSTNLYDQLGDDQARAVIANCMRIMTTVIIAHHGKLIKTIGDEIMGTFATPDQAAAAAIAMQENTGTDPQLNANHIQLRIGLHHGPVIAEGNDVFGNAVNMAASMVAQAKAGQIITTGVTLKMMNPEYHRTARLVDKTRIKGKQGIIDIFELTWGQPEELTLAGTNVNNFTIPKMDGISTLTLTFQGQKYKMDSNIPTITLGRDNLNQIVVKNSKVSRWHARIELLKGKFILKDHSTNGTYIMTDDGKMTLLRRDEIALQGSGVILLYPKDDQNPNTAIRFDYQAF